MGICQSCGAKLDHVLVYELRTKSFLMGLLDEEGYKEFDYCPDAATPTILEVRTKYACPICDAPLELKNEAEVKAFLRAR